jgi:3-hydroxyacyl-CoA dehydrogenase / enoyl-CoA hydratase / 3-hydroxybutyryl-CoA epimerase
MSTKQTFKHWRLSTDNQQILWVLFDKAGAKVNTLDQETMEEFSDIVDIIAADTEHKGVIITSAKKGFIAGADISTFGKFKDIETATATLTRGHDIFIRLAAIKKSIVAMIDGFCVGGGLELALACHFRVAEDGDKTRLGLPEVKLGIHPGWGGTVRLPRLIGAPQALNLILDGHTVTGKTAAKLGFIDVAVPKRHLATAAQWYALGNAKPHQPSFLQKMTNRAPMRKVIAYFVRKKIRSKINPSQYPAPFEVLNNWERFGVEGKAPFQREARTCGKLFFSETSENLVRIFFLQQRMKALGKDHTFDPQHVHVIGAGTMGGDIAAWAAFQGMTVTLQDREAKFIAPAIKRAFATFKEKLKEPYKIQKVMDRLIPDPLGNGVGRADVIIEAIYEDLAAKQSTFKTVEEQAKPDAILGTNTSSIPLDEINTVLNDPERLVGIHFFNPVAKMQLVEVVKGTRTKKAILEKAIAFVHKLDRLPLPVKSSPGFLINRILMPYLLEAVTMIKEGIPMTIIDKAMLEFGMPMGPVTLSDTVGLDVCLSVAKHLSKYFPNTTIPQQLADLVDKGKLGRKTGEGFYKYINGKQVKPPTPPYHKPLKDISDRLVLTMVNEAFACLREGVVEDSDLLDAGMVFGTGFAPFRGGPIHYAKSQGIHELFQEYVNLQKARGVKTTSLKEWEVTEA